MRTKRPCPTCGGKDLDVVRTYSARSPNGDITVHHGNCTTCGRWRDQMDLPQPAKEPQTAA